MKARTWKCLAALLLGTSSATRAAEPFDYFPHNWNVVEVKDY
jgi:hypothetical protein